MKEINAEVLDEVRGGGDLPAAFPAYGPSEAYIAAILALFSPPRPSHMSD